MLSTSPNITNIATALLAFQGAVDGVGKNSNNPAFRSRYANLEAVIDTAKPELQRVGVVFIQSAGAIVEGVMAMTTRLIHVESGEWIEGTMDIALGKRDPQGVGSASTYAARYSLMHMLGLPPIDDDGETAIDRNNSRPEPALGAGKPPKNRTPDLPQGNGNFETMKPAAGSRDTFSRMMDGLRKAGNLGKDQLRKFWTSGEFQEAFPTLPKDWRIELEEEKNAFIASYEKKPGGLHARDPNDSLNQQFAATMGEPT